MKRRDFAPSLIAFGLGWNSIAYARPKSTSFTIKEKKRTSGGKQIHRLRFTKHFFIDRLGTNAWSISIIPQVLGKYRKRELIATLQIATDPSFSQIIEQHDILINSSNGFLARFPYEHESLTHELHTRFFLEQRNRPKHGGDHIAKLIYSETKKYLPGVNLES